MTLTRALAAGLLLSAAVAAQNPQFEVASIRPSAEVFDRADVGLHISGAQMHISQFSLRDYVAMAYDTPVGQIVAPEWLAQTRFDISAKLPEGVPSDRLAEMIQRLLADRFALKAHKESKVFDVYALVVRKEGLKLPESTAKPSDPDAQPAPGTVNVGGSGSAAGVFLDFGGGSSFSLANNRVEFTRIAMTDIAQTLSRLLDRRVIDATGLAARYDLGFPLQPEEYQAVLIRSAINAGVTLPPQALRALDAMPNEPFSAALQKFGLALESRRAPLDIVIVDSISRRPTEN